MTVYLVYPFPGKNDKIRERTQRVLLGGAVGAFIKRHWIAYLIGVVVAILVGVGASYYLGQRWSTPADVRAERIANEKAQRAELDSIGSLDGSD